MIGLVPDLVPFEAVKSGRVIDDHLFNLTPQPSPILLFLTAFFLLNLRRSKRGLGAFAILLQEFDGRSLFMQIYLHFGRIELAALFLQERANPVSDFLELLKKGRVLRFGSRELLKDSLPPLIQVLYPVPYCL